MLKIINNTNRPHVYIIRNLYNGMYYFGVHNGSKTNTYTGSSKQLNAEITVYGDHNFEKEVLYTFNTVEEAYLMEGAIVDWDKVRDPMCYNKQLGGYGGGKSGKNAADIHITNDYTWEKPQYNISHCDRRYNNHTSLECYNPYTRYYENKPTIAQQIENGLLCSAMIILVSTVVLYFLTLLYERVSM